MIAFVYVKMFDGSHKTYISFAYQISQIKSVILIFLCNINDKTQVCTYNFIFSGFIAGSCFYCQISFFFAAQKRDTVYITQIHSQNIIIFHTSKPPVKICYTYYFASSVPTF